MKYDIGAVLASYGADIPHLSNTGWRPIKCPFHADRQPSAAANQAEGRFHCFVCDIHEDAIGLVMERENVSFQIAKQTVEEITGQRPGDICAGDTLGGWFPERKRYKRGNGAKVGAWRSRFADTFT